MNQNPVLYLSEQQLPALHNDPGKPRYIPYRLRPDGLFQLALYRQPAQAPSPERLLEIARETGVREAMHGVAPSAARAMLARFFEAASQDAGGIPVAREEVAAPAPSACPVLVGGQPPRDGAKWMRIVWWRDVGGRRVQESAHVRQDALDEDQAHENHGQRLDCLRIRGGMLPSEALALVRRRRWDKPESEAKAFGELIIALQVSAEVRQGAALQATASAMLALPVLPVRDAMRAVA